MNHADDLQAVSVDEALIEVTSTVNRLRSTIQAQPEASTSLQADPAKDLAETIRAQVRKATGCEGMHCCYSLSLFWRYLQWALVLRTTYSFLV